MQAQVNRQRQGLAGLGVLGDLDVLDQPAAPVLDHLALARNPCEPFVVGQFHPFATAVVDIGETHHVRGYFAGWIEASEFLDAIDTGDLQIQYGLALFRRQASDQIDELFIGLGFKPLGQGFRVLAKCHGQRRPAILGQLHFLGIGPEGGHGRTDGQRLAIAIGDQTAVRGNRNVPDTACIALPLEEVTVDHLQVDDAPGNRRHHDRQQTQHYTETPWIERAFELHGATMRTSAAPGMCIFNCSVASTSMRL